MDNNISKIILKIIIFITVLVLISFIYKKIFLKESFGANLFLQNLQNALKVANEYASFSKNHIKFYRKFNRKRANSCSNDIIDAEFNIVLNLNHDINNYERIEYTIQISSLNPVKGTLNPVKGTLKISSDKKAGGFTWIKNPIFKNYFDKNRYTITINAIGKNGKKDFSNTFKSSDIEYKDYC
jgi:uncharacterized ubiquitin-like protein YukD